MNTPSTPALLLAKAATKIHDKCDQLVRRASEDTARLQAGQLVLGWLEQETRQDKGVV